MDGCSGLADQQNPVMQGVHYSGQMKYLEAILNRSSCSTESRF